MPSHQAGEENLEEGQSSPLLGITLTSGLVCNVPALVEVLIPVEIAQGASGDHGHENILLGHKFPGSLRREPLINLSELGKLRPQVPSTPGFGAPPTPSSHLALP